MSDDIREAKQKLPVPALLHRLGLGQHAKKSAKCPFHEDRHNSFSVWQDGDGWAFKCHAGCGAGDEINFLELHEKLSRRDAVKRFLGLAGDNGSAPYVPPPNEINQARSAFDWRACVSAFTDKHLERLAKWRGYSIEFCSWLKNEGLIGLHAGCIAFPVHDEAGHVVGAHYRLRGDDNDWRYYPTGTKTRPLVIGELLAGDRVCVFESQWDAFVFMDASGERSGILISRGASNGPLVADLIPPSSTVYVWTQNDAPGEKWQQAICANTKATIKRASIPEKFNDLNDWTRAGATDKELLATILSAEVVREDPDLAAHSGRETYASNVWTLSSLSAKSGGSDRRANRAYFIGGAGRVDNTTTAGFRERDVASVAGFALYDCGIMKTLFIAWKDSVNTHAWYPVGRLDANTEKQRYRFRYLQGALEANRDCGFTPFDSFPHFERNYVSAELFPLFANRLQNASRPSFQEYLRRLDFELDAPDAIDPIEMLATSEGRRVTDNLEVFPKVERSIDGSFSIKFFLHGWRHIHPSAAERIGALKVNERLGLSLETTNPVTTWALQIQTADHLTIGWAPRYLFEDLTRVILEGACVVEATVARVNPPPAPPGQRLMVRFRGCWPEGYEPMSSEKFRPLVTDEIGPRSKLAISPH